MNEPVCMTEFAVCAFGLAPNKQQINQACLNGFNNSAVGKVANFLSPLSALIGPDRLKSAVETGVFTPLKFAAVKGGQAWKATAPGWEAGTARVVAGDLADLVELGAETIALPLVAGATATQVLAHAYCGNNASAAVGQTYSAPGQGYISF